ncbi:hypothetical protein ALP03_02025 [Pseudomonas amygdali pv. tabaci]|uniref:Uncharacterized protein n=1 Tax=Pseudomonas amygdali pv. tabaci TaxID=322 RepID=A0A3M6HJT3_PSEAJ|nr:hypothetical protein ALQ26_02075 [Pseudomonas amygdali pv. lachrymans]RMW05177.1 hypothetical protein ALP03_02025 [Pseudomonas amygdali pv. tabaci]
MFTKKIRKFLLLGVLALLLAAVGYWNISPESFMDQPVSTTRSSTTMQSTPTAFSTCPTARFSTT